MQPTLYHAIKIEHLHPAICRNALRGYSTHRIADNGLVPWCKDHKNPPQDYLDSKWYFGVCLTRDIRFARQWNEVVLEIDRPALVARNKVIPYNWMETKVKAEAEEFVVTGYAGFNCDQALLHMHREDDQVRRNVKFLTNDDSFVGEIDRLDLVIKSITVQLGDRPGQIGKLSAQAEKEMLSWRQSRFDKVKRDVFDFCEEHGIAISVQT